MASRRWFHRNVSGLEAEVLLKEQGTDGSFMVRPSESLLGNFSLSARLGEMVTHIRIQNTDDYFDLYGGEKFATLAELVEHYMNNWGVLKLIDGSPVYLKYPLLCADPTTERWFHGQIKGKTAEKMLGKEKCGCYLVRGSRSNPGDFVLSVKIEDAVIHVKIQCNEGKYEIAGDDKHFMSLSDLVENYKQNALTHMDGSIIKLLMPLNSTHISASRISDRIKELENDGTTSEKKANKGFMEEFEMLRTHDTNTLFERNNGKKLETRPKNRYKNILPFDFSRVVLKDGNPMVPGTDYINANILKNKEFPQSKREYIATQGCLQTTIIDFWRMIWQENSHIIVMTTKLVELGKNKCVQYWPAEGNTRNMKIFTGTLKVTNSTEKKAKNHIVREFNISFQSNDAQVAPQPPRKVYHFHFTGWPDHGVPVHPDIILDFIQEFGAMQDSIPSAGPIVVHCSAGIGRTGTIIITDMILQQIKHEGLNSDIDIQKMTLMVRRQRSGMVQTESQYKFIYMAVKRYIEMQAEQENSVNDATPGHNGNGSKNKTPPTAPEKSQLYENIEVMKTKASPHPSSQQR